jgi:hypothetical protein
MMAIFGWLMLCVILGFVSAGVLLIVANNIGQWNIGGASNSIGNRIGAVVAVIVLFVLWVLVFVNKPFVIVGV